MAVVKFDVSGSDPEKARGFERPVPGVYTAKVRELKTGFKKGEDDKPDKSAPRLEVILEITKGKYKGAPIYDYIPFAESMQWKLDQFLLVFGIATNSKRKGQFKTENVVGLPVKIQLRPDTFNGEASTKMGAYLEANDEDIVDDEDEEMEDESEEEEGDEDEAEDEEDEEEEEEEDEDSKEAEGYTEDDLNSLNLEGLNEILVEYGEANPKGVKGKAAKITRILELQPEALGGEEDDEEEDESSDDYDSLDRAALAVAVKERGLKVLKKDDEDSLRLKLREDDNRDPFE